MCWVYKNRGEVMIRNGIVSLILVVGLCVTGCDKSDPPTPRPPSSSTPSKPPTPPSKPAPPIPSNAKSPHGGNAPKVKAPEPKKMADVDVSGVAMSDKRTILTGVSFANPDGWVVEKPVGMSRVAQFRLPNADNNGEGAQVAVTHFPGMKGMDERNLARWYGQFTQPDGTPSAAAASKSTFSQDGVSVTLIEVSGTMGAAGPMMGGGSAKENYRMLAAIVDHPKGPHFVKITGPDAVVKKWKASAVAFLKSAKVNK